MLAFSSWARPEEGADTGDDCTAVAAAIGVAAALLLAAAPEKNEGGLFFGTVAANAPQ